MLHDLLSMDLQGWHPRKNVPDTDALRRQKILSLKGVSALVLLVANEGKLDYLQTDSRPNAVVTSGEGHGTGFIAWAKRVVPSLRHHTGPNIKNELIEKWGCEKFSRDGKRGLDFPRLADFRATFEKLYGPYTWDNPEMTDWEKPPVRGPDRQQFERD